MTKQQITWAMTHDWAIEEQSDSVIVRDYDFVENEEIQIVFSDFKKLKIWAGY